MRSWREYLSRARPRRGRGCAEKGFMVGATFIPFLPYLSDQPERIEEMSEEARGHGASYLFTGTLTLQGAGKQVYLNALKKSFPELAQIYRALYRRDWAPPKSYQEELDREFRRICAELGLRYQLR